MKQLSMRGQPYSGQPYSGQPYSDQPYSGQPYSDQPYSDQPYSDQPYSDQPSFWRMPESSQIILPYKESFNRLDAGIRQYAESRNYQNNIERLPDD